MTYRWFIAPILLSMGLLLLPGCGDTPESLPTSDTGEVDDLMDEMEVPPPE